VHGMKRLEAVMSATLGQERRLLEFTTGGKLCRMLRNTLRSYPQAKVQATRDVFGAVLDENTYLLIRTSGNLTVMEKRDLLVLFATWLVVDPGFLTHQSAVGQSADTTRSGVS
jgi:hypothetical protein